MPRIDRRRLRTGLRLDLPDDPVSNRGYSAALKVQLVGATAVLVGVVVVPHVARDDRVLLFGLLVLLIGSIAVLMATLARHNPRLAWCITTLMETTTILVGMLVVPGVFVAGLIAYTIVVAATTAIGGLGIGLLVSGIAATAAILGTAVASGEPEAVATTCVLAIVSYPTIAFSIDGFTLSRNRAATQLARLHETLREVIAEPSLSATLDAVVDAVRNTFGSDSAVVLLDAGGHLELVAPGVFPAPQWTAARVAQLTATALRAPDATPVAWAMSRGETIVVRDIETEPRFTSGGDAWRQRLRILGLSSMVVVPLRRGRTPVGLLHVCFQRPGALDDEELALLEAYADQATIVILRAQAYAELEAAAALKSEFLATVSHELRTPLTATKGFVDTVLLQWDRLDDGQRRQLLQRASTNAAELARLIDQLLDYSRLDTGTVQVVPVDRDLGELIEGLVARMAPVLDDHVVVVDADGEVAVHVDPDAFAHVLGNLLTNAANFSQEGSAIRVVARIGDGCALVSVIDEGIGVAPDEHERIFERFYRVGADSGTGRGTGIGLAIASRFVELLGGRIWIESELGSGAVFSFTVPLTETTGAAVPRTNVGVAE